MRRKAPCLFEEIQEEESLINLTPLIDVVFIVLITFMIIAPILNVESIDLALAGPFSQKESPSNSSLSISIKADNTIWLRGKRFTLQELDALLHAEKKLHPKQIPQVAPEKQAPFGTYQQVKNLLETVGFEQMEVLLN